jgi:hypothetical protein
LQRLRSKKVIHRREGDCTVEPAYLEVSISNFATAAKTAIITGRTDRQLGFAAKLCEVAPLSMEISAGASLGWSSMVWVIANL